MILIMIIIGLFFMITIPIYIKVEERAAREEEDEAALEAALTAWIEEPTKASREKINKALEKRYG